jgi:DNA-binding MarR family transcriptional regulator
MKPSNLSIRSADISKPSVEGENSAGCQEMARRFMWVIASINVYMHELCRFQAKQLGITGPQWTILLALADLDRKHGIPVNVVAKLMHVDASFVTTQSKLLEKQGFLRRLPSKRDARVVQMSLTDKSCKHFARIATQQEAIDEFIFREFDDQELTKFMSRLAALGDRFARARSKVALDIV